MHGYKQGGCRGSRHWGMGSWRHRRGAQTTTRQMHRPAARAAPIRLLGAAALSHAFAALAALEAEAGLRVKEQAPRGSQLLQASPGAWFGPGPHMQAREAQEARPDCVHLFFDGRTTVQWWSSWLLQRGKPGLITCCSWPHHGPAWMHRLQPLSAPPLSLRFSNLSRQLVYDHIERQLADASLDDTAASLRRLEDSLLRGGSSSSPGDCPTRLQRSIEGLHGANIIAVCCWPERRLAITGSSDGSVAVLGYDGTLHRSIAAGSSGVLCLALRPSGSRAAEPAVPAAPAAGNPDPSSGGSSSNCGASSIVAAGCMDGSVVLLDAESGQVLASARPHRKYCVR